MCSPTLAIAGFSAFLQYQAGQNEAASIKATAQNNAAISEFNAKQNEAAATQATRQGAQDASVIRENVRRANSTARAKLASAGLDADVGTPGNLIEQNTQMGETNAMTAMRDAQLKAMGFTNEAIGNRFDAEMGLRTASFQSKVAKKNGLLSAAGTLVTGASSSGLFSPKSSQSASGMGYSPMKSTTKLSSGQTITWR